MMNRLTKAYDSGALTLDADNFKPFAQEAIDAEISASPLLKAVVERLYEYEEKNQPKEPSEVESDYFVCPQCGAFITALDEFSTHKYCLNCGQALDWSVNNE